MVTRGLKAAGKFIKGFDDSYKYIVDYDFFLRIGSKFGLFSGEELVSKWRIHKNQASQEMKTIMFDESNQIFYKYFYYDGITNKTRMKMVLGFVKRCLKRVLYKGG